NGNGCKDSTTVSDYLDTAKPSAAITDVNSITCKSPFDTLDGTSSSTNSGNINYSWRTTGGNITDAFMDASLTNDSASIEVNDSGTYEMLVTDPDNNCEDSTSAFVSLDTTKPSAAITDGDSITCAKTTDTLSGTSSSTSSGSANYDWAALTGNILSDLGDSIIVDDSGDYKLVVTDSANGCKDSTVANVSMDTTSPVASITGADTITCSKSTDTLDGTSSSTNSGNVNYTWNTTTGSITNNLTDSIVISDSAYYELIVKDPNNGCTDEDSVYVEKDGDLPTISIATPDTITCNNDTSTIDASASSTVNNAPKYSWSAPGISSIATNNDSIVMVIDSGSYTLTLEDTSNGCNTSQSVDVILDTTAPTSLINGADSVTCVKLADSLDGSSSSTSSGNINYSWTSNGGNITADLGDSVIVDDSGSYELTITDSKNGCQDSSTAKVTLDTSAPVASITDVEKITCASNLDTLDGTASSTNSGNINYTWSVVSNGNISSNLGDSIIVDDSGTYELLITDPSNGCQDSINAVPGIDTTSPSPVISGEDTLSCVKNTDTLTGTGSSTNSGNISYSWSVVNNGNIKNNLGDSIIVNDSGTYKLVITDPQSGCMDSTTALVDIDTGGVLAKITGNDTITCSKLADTLDGSGSSTSSGNINYTWSPNGGNITSDFGDSVIVNDSGNYELKINDPDNGCKDSTTALVDIDTGGAFASIFGNDTLTCNKTTDTLIGTGSSTSSGNVEYAWSASSSGNITSNTQDDSVVVDDSGSYELLVTDSVNGCKDSTTAIVDKNTTLPTALISQPDTFSCNTDSILLTDSTSSTASGSMCYSWNSITGGNILSGQGTDSVWVDAPGDYEMILTDCSNGCSDTATVTAPQDNNVPTVTLSNLLPDTLNCENSLDTLYASVSANDPGDIVLTWQLLSGGNIVGANADSSMLYIDKPGKYEATVTDTSNGCSSSSTIT
ncbi:MAG: beta strand repeat-containing protein, partial [Flavobacteriales bacterium]